MRAALRIPVASGPLARVLERLPGHRRSGRGYIARCPVHEDGTPSLGVDEGSDGDVLLMCHAGCPTPAVVAALGLTMADLFVEHTNGSGKRVVASYTYTDATGTPVFYRDRREWMEGGKPHKDVLPRQPDGTRKGTPPVPYRLHEMAEAIREDGTIVLVEGEKAADALREHGYTATTTGSATSWKAAFAKSFRGARVVLWPDADVPGEQYIADAARDLAGVVAELRVLRFDGKADGWDAADYFVEGGTKGQLDQLLADAPTMESAPAVREEPKPAGGRTLVLKRLLEGDAPPPPTLHTDRFLLAGDVNFLGGNGDAGKSTIMFNAAVCTVLGRPMFGTLAVRRPGAVVLLVPEDGECVARHHVDALTAGMALSDRERAQLRHDLHIVGDDRPFNLLRDTAALGVLLTDVRPSLLIADPLTSLLGAAEENDELVANAACANLRRDIARPFDTAILVAGHLRKPSREAGSSSVADVFDFKGSVGWSNHARIVWTVSKPKGGNLITLRLVKSNRLPTGIEHQVTLAIEANPENAAHWLTCRLTDANLGAASQSLTPGVGRAINDNERKALHALNDRLEPGARFSRSRWHSESGIVSVDTFRGVKDRLLDSGLATASKTGRMNPNGRAPVYEYGITDRGRTALNTGWAAEGVKG